MLVSNEGTQRVGGLRGGREPPREWTVFEETGATPTVVLRGLWLPTPGVPPKPVRGREGSRLSPDLCPIGDRP